MENKLAEFILVIISRSTMPCDDVTLQNVATAKQWLKAIAEGKLVVNDAPVAAVEQPKVAITPADRA